MLLQYCDLCVVVTVRQMKILYIKNVINGITCTHIQVYDAIRSECVVLCRMFVLYPSFYTEFIILLPWMHVFAMYELIDRPAF